jgi:hypothetical protein
MDGSMDQGLNFDESRNVCGLRASSTVFIPR